MQKLVLIGTRPENMTDVTPHLLDPSSEQKPSRFEMVFKHDGVLYTYGFVVSSTTVHEEWLFGYFSTQESLIFERITENNKTKIKAGPKLIADVEGKQFIEFIAKGTRPNQLFITEANEKNIAILKPVIHWYREHLQIIRPNSQYRALALRAHKEKEFTDFLSKFLHTADTGINAIKCESEDFEPSKHLSDFPEDIRQKIKEDLTSGRSKQILIQTPTERMTICKDNPEGTMPAKFLRLKTEHIKTDGATALFDTSIESDGTRRLMDLAPMLLEIRERDRVFIIDELDRSLHTLLSRLFIQTCIAGVTEKQAHGQFIMTTHDTNLLDRSLLRRDEIWFMEKDKMGASHLTSLAEYSVSDGLNYANGYLNGRFGAIPFVGNIQNLFE